LWPTHASSLAEELDWSIKPPLVQHSVPCSQIALEALSVGHHA
jgi:hypothetical protein